MKFREIRAGDCFLDGGTAYMKVSLPAMCGFNNINAVCLDNGALCWFRDDKHVKHCTAQVTVYRSER